MTPLAQQRCFRHDVREAAGRCPSCQRYYCRECLTEHDHRLLCVTCLAKLPSAALPPPRRPWRLDYAYPLLGLLLAFTLFYWLGQTLILATTDFRGTN
ncbi:MAG: hypothetical protein K2X03_19180 [Bryobacteraceae bacterium]|nr:hypothetical protein [Bryobacteraceae bacterium]